MKPEANGVADSRKEEIETLIYLNELSSSSPIEKHSIKKYKSEWRETTMNQPEQSGMDKQ